jgi:hypothetical protein
MRLWAEVPEESHPLVVRANVLLPGLYAWVSTVLFPAAAPESSAGAPLMAGLALTALVSGTIVGGRRPVAGRWLGGVLFVGLSAAAWVLLGPQIQIDRLEPVRASLGGVAWALFALGWGSLRRPGDVPEDDPRAVVGDPLPARRSLPRGAPLVLGTAILVALAPPFLAWRVLRPEHALFSQAVALATAIAVISAGAVVAVERGRWRARSNASERLASASVPLTLLAVLAIAGLIRTLID